MDVPYRPPLWIPADHSAHAASRSAGRSPVAVDSDTIRAALALGSFAGIVNARLMAYLRRTGISGELSEQHLRGSIARVVLSVGDHHRGRVEIDVAGQPLFMVARPYRDGREDLLHGEHVVVVEVKQGTAYVTAAPELGGGI